MALTFSETFKVEDDFVTGRDAMMGMSGSGKSNGGVVYAEQLWHRRLQFVAIDPKGDWWGVRSNVDGTGPGLPIPVFGGIHGDIPLEPTAGAVMASLVIDKDLTCVLDISDFDEEDQVRFALEFTTALWRLIRHNPRPMHLFLDEAEEVVPQVMGKRGPAQKAGEQNATAAMVRMVSRICKQGRKYGLGVTLLAQRSANVNKNALSQVETVIAFCTRSAADRDAILNWITDDAIRAEVKSTIGRLAPGEAWFLSPDSENPAVRFRWNLRSTFDSGATPKVGEERREPANIATIDLGEIASMMAVEIETAKMHDPEHLRNLVADLEFELAKAHQQKPGASSDAANRRIADLESQLARERANPITVAVVPPKLITTLVNAHGAVDQAVRQMETRTTELGGVLGDVLREVKSVQDKSTNVRALPSRTLLTQDPAPAPAPKKPQRRLTVVAPDAPMSPSAWRILAAVAPYPDGCAKKRASMLAGITHTKSTWRAGMADLARLGYVTRPTPDLIVPTEAGIAALGDSYEPLPTGAALLDMWMERLPSLAKRVLQLMIDHPLEWEREDISRNVGDPAPSTLRAALADLRKLGLVDGWRIDPDFLSAITENARR